VIHLLYILLMKQQFVVSHTTHQTEISALVDSWVTKTSSIKILCPKNKKINKNSLSFLHKNITCLIVALLRISEVFLSPIQLCICGLQQVAVS